MAITAGTEFIYGVNMSAYLRDTGERRAGADVGKRKKNERRK